ncbi:MAG: hypothetical protein KDB03_18500 [Planctomycetales bacterium]|nr:hypothetical protein [Planctomycetales bacterium]
MLIRQTRSILLFLISLWVLSKVVFPFAQFLLEQGHDPQLESVKRHLQAAANDGADWAQEQIRRHLTREVIEVRNRYGQ